VKEVENNKVKHGITCDICDERVTMATKQDGEGIGHIWVCKECNEKYPRWKN
tara:strand:- start:1848 stop:2003 length:156 start_codon:yes stop_codon:yes gene_type:complete